MKNYVNLHAHGVYSLLDGVAKPEAYATRAAELGQQYACLTDHGNIHGQLDFYDACKAAGVKPILGMEAYQARKTRYDRDPEERAGPATVEFEQRGPYHLTLLVRNLTGYRNLIKLSSRAFLEGYYAKARLDYELLAEHSDGITILSGCLSGAMNQALLRDDYPAALAAAARLQDVAGKENFYVEIHDHGIAEQEQVKAGTLAVAKSLNALIVPTCDSHYVHKYEGTPGGKHDASICVSTKSTIAQEKRFRFQPEEFHLKSYQEMRERFPDDWLSNTLTVAESVELNLQFGELYFPEFDIPDGEEVNAYLEREVYAGLHFRYGGQLPQDVLDRTQYELGVVRRMGFQHYFLVVADLVKWARDNGIRSGWGRGSAAGSIMSYALRITNLDPLRFGLLFERFLVEGRKSMPDIDLDFDDRYRDRVIDYARSKYGSDRVANICTFSTIGSRSAIRDSARILDRTYQEGDKLAKLVPIPILGIAPTLESSLESSEFRKAYDKDETSRLIIDTAKGLEGLVRQTGIHAAGIIITRTDITDYVPVMRKTDKRGNPGPIVTQWDMDRVDQNGLLKIDFLGLRNLGVIDMCLATIKERSGEEINLDTLSLDDPLTYEKLREGQAIGTFQLESSGMRRMMQSLQPSCIEDIMALIALFRPGPLGSHMDKLFISRRLGRTKILYEHPKLAEALEPSYGVMLYQEDVLAVARILAGFSAGEGDDLRKAIGKKQMDKIGKFRNMFVEGCREVSNVDSHLANKLYSDIEFHGGYSFNRAHAASYAMVSYVTAYLKFHYPTEYMAALLTSVDTKKEAAPYLNECRRMGISVVAPSISHSNAEFVVSADDEILFGLRSVAGIGKYVVEFLLSERHQYTNVYDFLRRVNPESLNKSTLEHLVHSGAMDELMTVPPDRSLSRAEKIELLDLEKRELGLYVSDHPLVDVWHVLKPKVTCTLDELELQADNQYVTVGGILAQVEKRITRAGQTMFILMLEDLTGFVEVLVFPGQSSQLSGDLVEGTIVLIEGRLRVEGGVDGEERTHRLTFQKLYKVEIPDAGGDPITLVFPEAPSLGILDKIEQLIELTPGDSAVHIEFPEGPHIMSMRFKKPTSLSIQHELELLTLQERVGL